MLRLGGSGERGRRRLGLAEEQCTRQTRSVVEYILACYSHTHTEL